MTQIQSNVLKLMTFFITGSLLLSSLTGCGGYKEWKQKEQARMIQTTREEILMEIAERKAEREANKNWLQRHWTGVSITSIVVLTTVIVGMASFILLNPPQSIIVDATEKVLNQISKNAREIRNNTEKIRDIETRLTEDERKIDVNKGQTGAARKDASGALSKVWGIKDNLYQNEQKLNDISQKVAAANNLAIKNADKIVDLSRAVDQLKN